MRPEGSAPPPERRRAATGWAAAALVALVAVVHGQSLSPEWTWVFDDFRFVVLNPHVKSPESWTAFLTDPATTDPRSPAGIVRPLRTLEFALDARLFGLEPAAFHLHSLLWFAVGSVMVLLLVRDLLGDLRAAFVGAAVWTLHPMQTEAVDWISSRGDVASGALAVASVWTALRARGRVPWTVASLVLAALSMLYKESGVAVPALVVLATAVRRAGPEGRPPFLRTCARAWPWFAVAGAYLVYRSQVQVGTTAHVTTYVLGGSTEGTFATMFRGFGAYLGFALLPVRPAVDWILPSSTSILAPAPLAWLAVHAALLVAGLRGVVRGSLWGAAILWFYAALAPVANWPFFLGIPTAERFLHVALVAVALVAALAARAALRVAPSAWVPVGVACLSLGTISFLRAGTWKNHLEIWRSTTSAVDSPRGEAVMAAELRRDGVAARAAAIRLPPGPERARLEAEATGAFEAALGHAHRALRIWYELEGRTELATYIAGEPHVNASNLCFLLGRPGEALFHAEEAIRIQEDGGFERHYDRALALLDLARGASALRSTARARELGLRPSREVLGMLERAASHCEGDGETALARAALADAAALGVAGSERAAGTLAALERRTDDTVAALRARVADAAAAGDPSRARVALAIALAADGRIAEADEAVAPLGGPDAASPLGGALWIHARWAARGTREGWEEALRRADALSARSRDHDLAFFRGRCAEELGRDAEALAAFREFLEGAGAGEDPDPRVRRARAAVERLDRPCPDLAAVPFSRAPATAPPR